MAIVGTPSQTAGPLWGFALMFHGCEHAVDPSDPDAIRVEGMIVDGADEPFGYPDSFVEVWQGEQFARARTDEQGRYSVTVAKPGPVSLSDGRLQAPHLNVSVFGRGLLKQAQTRLYFPDEAAANESDPVLQLVDPDRRSSLIARADGGGLRFDIMLQGDRETETVFFDF
jgi:protocatechuate 3,4-dioxygenase alpha subunit